MSSLQLESMSWDTTAERATLNTTSIPHRSSGGESQSAAAPCARHTTGPRHSPKIHTDDDGDDDQKGDNNDSKERVGLGPSLDGTWSKIPHRAHDFSADWYEPTALGAQVRRSMTHRIHSMSTRRRLASSGLCALAARRTAMQAVLPAMPRSAAPLTSLSRTLQRWSVATRRVRHSSSPTHFGRSQRA